MKRSIILLSASIIFPSFLSAGTTPGPVSCSGNFLSYTEVSDQATSFPTNCGSLRCRPPILVGSPLSKAPGCDPYLGPCAITGTFPVTYEGLHQNPDVPGYSIGEVQLYSSPGNSVDTCGSLGSRIRFDEGVIGFSTSIDCRTSSSYQFQLVATMCPGDVFCPRPSKIPLDLRAVAGCRKPLPGGCGNKDSAAAGACCLGPGGESPPVPHGGGEGTSRGLLGTEVSTYAPLGAAITPPYGAPRGMTLHYQAGGAG